ncbi:small multi-drug export protein [Patescibacteria group bacterium]|nr:small multi-drug export protein [Patescibacteria group bacterium]
MIVDVIKIFLISTLPIVELRGAIPMGIIEYEIPFQIVFFVAIFGNILPIFFIAWFMEKFIRKSYEDGLKLPKLLHLKLLNTEKKAKNRVEKIGELALIPFVAIPLPLTGAWTGILVAFIFKIPYKKAFPLIFIGLIISGIIVTLSTLGLIKIF